MKMTRIVFACVLALLTPLRGAAAAGAEGATKPEGPTDVSLPPILAPMMVGDRLDNYAYITIALTPAAPDKTLLIREKVPFLRDGFLREVNKASIGLEGKPKEVDQAALKARLTARMNQVLPKGTVSDIKFEQIVFTPVRQGP